MSHQEFRITISQGQGPHSVTVSSLATASIKGSFAFLKQTNLRKRIVINRRALSQLTGLTLGTRVPSP